MNEHGDKVVLPRQAPQDFWKLLDKHYVKKDPSKWRDVAALVLREQANWSYERIGMALGYDRGHVHRILSQMQSEMQQIFTQPADWPLDHPDKESPA